MGFPPVGCIGLPQSAIAPSRDGIGVKLYHWDKQIGTLFPSVSPAGMYVAARSTPSRLIWAIVTRAASPTHMGVIICFCSDIKVFSLVSVQHLLAPLSLHLPRRRKPWATPNKAKRHSQTAYIHI
ncbi:hypothetical protein PCASD_16006 [Puccinia coronata f. sp. avenae]|uniref:Uncharacterized protein n=1 Tax=Puccinia coronata f. sp. avenae TaxID=200324 RepID=A0A2N5TUF1_9BASI|nr:hypothetical protein PCASD_16006 [Puccinia coronata f. sp. avenae]